MSTRGPAVSARRTVRVVLFVALLLIPCALQPAAAQGAPAAIAGDAPTALPESLIVRVFVNAVPKGDIPALRDARGRILVDAADFARWELAIAAPPTVVVKGDLYVDVAAVPGLEVSWNAAAVTLDLRVPAHVLPGTRLDLAPRRRPDVTYPGDTSIFLNYGANATGDDSFGQRSYQFTTELGARTGSWLLYNSTNQQWGEGGATNGFTRLLTNLQYDDRANLRRLTLGDFFTPSIDLAGSVPLGGLSFGKYYSMDPYFVQYPTASFKTQVSLPSTVVVRVDGNVIAQQQVPPGPLDIANITGITGGQNVSVTLRDAFGREQQLQRPFYFATNAGLAEGLHEYSYNLGFVRQNYGTASADYGPLAAAGFHRYAFSDELTLGLRGQATTDLFNVGPFGTWQSPRFGLLAAGASVGGRDHGTGPAGTIAYSYTGGQFSLDAGVRYLSRQYAQLADLESPLRTRVDRYLAGSVYNPALGTLAGSYASTSRYEGPSTAFWNANYTRMLMEGRLLLTLNYTHIVEPASAYTWLLSVRYYFDRQTSGALNLGGSRNHFTQSVSLDRTIPQGEGFGYSLTAGHVGGGGDEGGFGQAIVQANAPFLTVGANYARASRPESGISFSQVFVAGSLGAVDGVPFAARPVLDSFALIRIPDMPDVPVYTNGWYTGRTNHRGEVVATNIASYYDNDVAFAARELPMDYVFATAQKVISPALRSGTLVAFDVRRNRAASGVLLQVLQGKPVPLEFRDIVVRRGETSVAGFTARRGEFYVEGLTPGEYELVAKGEPGCSARFAMPDVTDGVVNVGTLVCEPTRR